MQEGFFTFNKEQNIGTACLLNAFSLITCKKDKGENQFLSIYPRLGLAFWETEKKMNKVRDVVSSYFKLTKLSYDSPQQKRNRRGKL